VSGRQLVVAVLIAVTLAPRGANSQTEPPRTTLAPIVRTERAGAGVVRIVYNLDGAAGALFAVALEVSNDSGRSFDIVPRALTGDVGPGVSPGAEKTIVWDSSKDVDDLQLDRYVFRVRVSGAASPAAPGSPITGDAAPPAAGRGAPPATPSSSGTAVAARKGGGLSKGAIAALIGGAAAAGIGVAAKGKGGSGATTTSKTFTATISAPMVVQFALCRRTEAWTGTLSIALDVSPDGTVAGSGSTSVATRVESLTPVPNCPQEQVGGTGAATIPASQVTGTTSRFAFSGKRFVGATVAGDLSHDWSFTGSLASDVVTGTLEWTITFSGGGLGIARFDVNAR
jgi:hypothetical protein